MKNKTDDYHDGFRGVAYCKDFTIAELKNYIKECEGNISYWNTPRMMDEDQKAFWTGRLTALKIMTSCKLNGRLI